MRTRAALWFLAVPATERLAVFFHTVQNRIQHGIGPIEFTIGKCFYVFDDLIAIAFAMR